MLSVVCAASGLLMPPSVQVAQQAPALSSPRLRRWGWANVCRLQPAEKCKLPPAPENQETGARPLRPRTDIPDGAVLSGGFQLRTHRL